MRTIEEIKADIDVLESLWSNYTDTIDYDSDDCDLALRNALNLLYAERDGRCVVLPCKVGDKVWIIKNNNIHGNFAVTKESLFRLMCDMSVFGKTIFLTREEAEKALKGGAE